MLKNIFKAAKKLLKSPIGQFGIGLLAPQLPFLKGISPALLQGGIGLLSGAKPEDVLKGLALGAGQAALTGKGGISNFLMGDGTGTGSFMQSGEAKQARGAGGGILDLLKGGAKKILDFAIENPVDAAQIGLLATALIDGQDDPRLQDVDPRAIEGLDFGNFQKGMDEARFQAKGGIAGYEAGGEKMTSIGINANTGEPSGLVTGPGTGKSDSIRFVSSEAKVPTDISNGEFIITKEATDKIGPENLYALQSAVDKDAETFEEGQERMAMV
jgi:hypothetical protein